MFHISSQRRSVEGELYLCEVHFLFESTTRRRFPLLLVVRVALIDDIELEFVLNVFEHVVVARPNCCGIGLKENSKLVKVFQEKSN